MDRDAKGRFLPGNQAARIHGGYVKKGLEYQYVLYCLERKKPLSPHLKSVYQHMLDMGLI